MNAFPVRCRISSFIPVSGKSFAASHFTFVFPLATSSITSPTLGSSIAAAAGGDEFRTNLLFSFEKSALRDAIKSPEGAKASPVLVAPRLHPARKPSC